MKTYEEILTLMQDTYKGLSGFDADAASDIGIRLRVLAKMLHQSLGELEELKNQVFVQTATGAFLELHAETRGITRKNALPAKGLLRFSRETPAQSDISIAKGIICSTRPDPQVRFETTEEAILKSGEKFVDIPAQAVDLGLQGNIAAGAVCLMVTPAPGISSATNPAGFYGGVDAESDSALRARLLRSFSSISNGTNCAFYYDIAMEQDGVASAKVLPRLRGRGTVDVVIFCHDASAEPPIVAALQEELEHRKEINVDVQVSAAIRDTVPISAEISLADGADAEHVLSACKACIGGYVAELGVGNPLLLAPLCSSVLSVDGVVNCKINAPTADLSPLSNHIIEAGNIQVKRMAVG